MLEWFVFDCLCFDSWNYFCIVYLGCSIVGVVFNVEDVDLYEWFVEV